MKNKILEEIKEWAPILASMDKTNPFKVPNGYFDSLENRIVEELGGKAPEQTTVPKDYFDSLPDKVIQQVTVDKEAKVIPFHYKKWISVAAAFIVIFGAGIFFTQSTSPSSDASALAFEMDTEEAIDYLIETGELNVADLIALEIYLEDFEDTEDENSSIDDTDLDDFLNTLTQDELEELL